jgi:hypothetical protein
MNPEFSYKFRNGTLVKVDAYGNDMAPDEQTTSSSQERTFRESPQNPNDSMDVTLPNYAENQSNLQNADVNTQTSPTAKSPEGPSSGEPQSPGMKMLTKEELKERDLQAVAYSKALLVEGDTLVYITYPGDSKCFDSTGFEISATPHRVHSSRLLATGSKVFEKLLGPTDQFRILRRKKLMKTLPRGISFVLDLTPPDEGDEAVELTAELSCSFGVRCWYTSATRCNIAKTLVAGEDEVIYSRKIVSYGSPTVNTANSSKSTSTDIEEKNDSDIWHSYGTHFVNRDLDEAIQTSAKELEKSKAKKKTMGQPDVPEYCPVRHRAGIGRLLHVLEGKDPRLDSAPKVWTLYALAEYFDCASAVVSINMHFNFRLKLITIGRLDRYMAPC